MSPTELAQYDLSAKFNPTKLKELSTLAVKRFNERALASKPQNSDSGTVSPVEALGSKSSTPLSESAPPVVDTEPGEAPTEKPTKPRGRPRSTSKGKEPAKMDNKRLWRKPNQSQVSVAPKKIFTT